MLAERFSITPSVEAYRRVVADLATQVRTVHDEEAVIVGGSSFAVSSGSLSLF